MVLGDKVSLIVRDVVLQDCFVGDFVVLVLTGRLESFDKLFLVLIKILDQSLESVNLLTEVLRSLSVLAALFLAHAQVSLQLLCLISRE